MKELTVSLQVLNKELVQKRTQLVVRERLLETGLFDGVCQRALVWVLRCRRVGLGHTCERESEKLSGEGAGEWEGDGPLKPASGYFVNATDFLFSAR